jgi:hypothetical protein
MFVATILSSFWQIRAKTGQQRHRAVESSGVASFSTSVEVFHRLEMSYQKGLLGLGSVL